MKEVKVSAGIIVNQGKILCVQRGIGKYEYISCKYEFPGGKVEPGESGKEALKRELMEEMNLELRLEEMEPFMEIAHEYPDFKVILDAYVCRPANPAFALLEHIDHQWLMGQELLSLDWAAADLPIVRALLEIEF